MVVGQLVRGVCVEAHLQMWKFVAKAKAGLLSGSRIFKDFAADATLQK